MITPAPWPELNFEPFPDTQTQRLAAWQAVGNGTTNPSRTRAMSREWVAPVFFFFCFFFWFWGITVSPEAGGVHVCTDPYLLPYPNRGEPLGTRHIPSLLLVRILSGGQSKWQAGRWAMSSPFLSLQISLTLSAPRFASLLQSIEVQRLVGSKGRCHLPHHSASLFVHLTGLLPSRDIGPRAVPGDREAHGSSTYPYRACDSAGPDTSGATRLLGGAVRPRSRLRSWGRVAVTSRGPALPVIGGYVPRQN